MTEGMDNGPASVPPTSPPVPPPSLRWLILPTPVPGTEPQPQPRPTRSRMTPGDMSPQMSSSSPAIIVAIVVVLGVVGMAAMMMGRANESPDRMRCLNNTKQKGLTTAEPEKRPQEEQKQEKEEQSLVFFREYEVPDAKREVKHEANVDTAEPEKRSQKAQRQEKEEQSPVFLKKYEAPGARKTIYHLKNVHFAGTHRHPKKLVRFISNINDDIYSYLLSNNVKAVYAEGEYEGDEDKLKKEIRNSKTEFKYRFSLDSIGEWKKQTEKQVLDKGFLPAWRRLALEKKLEMRALEEEEVVAKAAEMMRKWYRWEIGHEEYDRHIFYIREERILKRLLRRRDKELYIVMGKAHAFRDNIEKWNNENPGNKVSLIEVYSNCLKGIGGTEEWLRFLLMGFDD